jgi:hypothetical protein
VRGSIAAVKDIKPLAKLMSGVLAVFLFPAASKMLKMNKLSLRFFPCEGDKSLANPLAHNFAIGL